MGFIKDSDSVCGNCYFYEDSILFEQGLCKFNAPDNTDKRWPSVSSCDWCGKWSSFITREELDSMGKGGS